MRKVLYILGQLSDDDVEWMITNGVRRTVAAGQALIREGVPIDALYITLDGAFAITTAATGEKAIAQLGVGEIIGEISFVDARPPTATVTAQQDSVVFALDRRQLSDQLERDTHFAARFYRAIAGFLADRLRNTVSQLGYGDVGRIDEALEYQDELDMALLDNVHLAGARFERMLKRLTGGELR
jgi:bacteriocin-type transport-associated protein